MMWRTMDSERARETLAWVPTSSRRRRTTARQRRQPRDGTPTLKIVPDEHDRLSLAHLSEHKIVQSSGDVSEPTPENVERLDNYKPRGRTYKVSLIFAGEASSAISKLMTELKAENPNDVIKHALALLLSAQGKEILLRDPKTGAVTLVEI